MKNTVVLTLLLLTSSFYTTGNKNPPIEKFRHFGKILEVDSSSNMVNLAPFISYAQIDNLDQIEAFGEEKLSRLIRNRLTERVFQKKKKKISETWWYLRIKNSMNSQRMYNLKVGNNKVTEIICYRFRNTELFAVDTLGLTFKKSSAFLGPTIPFILNADETIEVMFFMPKRHTMCVP